MLPGLNPMTIQMNSNGRIVHPVLPQLDYQPNRLDLFGVHYKTTAQPRESIRRDSYANSPGFSSGLSW
ncbi:MAG: hypothetical protein A2Z97_08725 [Bdellovibrionales bacterium GWB1_52_6]|nr:MAG: hypothetical protein A2Z97_08725 [Bdellovibrionales bacterium GWB1_52_6]OFZ05595.1 MAG: hypothetical protein A2X97_12055 [Bdellovibrionales bacterium GWA1_52_35]